VRARGECLPWWVLVGEQGILIGSGALNECNTTARGRAAAGTQLLLSSLPSTCTHAHTHVRTHARVHTHTRARAQQVQVSAPHGELQPVAHALQLTTWVAAWVSLCGMGAAADPRALALGAHKARVHKMHAVACPWAGPSQLLALAVLQPSLKHRLWCVSL